MEPKVFFFLCSQSLKLEKSGKVIECAYPSLHIICPDKSHSGMTLCHCSCSQQIQIWNSLCIFSLTAGRAVRTRYAILIPSHGCQPVGGRGKVYTVFWRYSPERSYFPEEQPIASPQSRLAVIFRVCGHFTLSDLVYNTSGDKSEWAKEAFSLNFREWNYPAFGPVSLHFLKAYYLNQPLWHPHWHFGATAFVPQSLHLNLHPSISQDSAIHPRSYLNWVEENLSWATSPGMYHMLPRKTSAQVTSPARCWVPFI